MSRPTADRLRKVLGEGDRREVGRSAEVALEALDNPAILADLIRCLGDDDFAVVSHGAHAAMQIGVENPKLFQTYVDDLIDLLDRGRAWELGEQLPKILAELDLLKSQAHRLTTILVKQVDDRSAIVAASALTALKRLSDRGLSPGDTTNKLLEKALHSPSRAVAARARRLMKV